MRRPFRFLFISLLLLSSLASLTHCQEKKYVEPEPIPLPPGFKEWMFFKEGTFWVYQDSVTGAFDSVVVTRSENEIIAYPDKYDKKKIDEKSERILFETNSSLTGKKYRYVSTSRCFGDWRVDPNAHCFDIRCSDITEGDGGHPFDGNYIFSFQFYRVPVGYIGNHYVQVAVRYNSLQVGSNTYKDVVVNHQLASNNEGGLESWYTLAKGVGIVHRRHKLGNKLSARTLVRYHIVQ
jgi:hypothetical protein